MNHRLQFLFRHDVPAFGQWVTWILLVFALYLAVLTFEPATGVRQEQPATIFGLLPVRLLTAGWFYELVRWVLIISAFGWMFHRAVPYTCWSTCISFTLLWSLRIENSDHTANIFNLTNSLLVIHAMWFQFYYHAMREAKQNRVFRNSLLYPRWVFLLSLFCIGWFHTLAGLSKLVHTGFFWGDGLSMQLWVNLFADSRSPVSNLITSNRTFAAVLQTSILICETVSVFAVFNRWLRLLIGLALSGSYAVMITTFVDFGFHMNAILVVLFFLPLERVINGHKQKKLSSLI